MMVLWKAKQYRMKPSNQLNQEFALFLEKHPPKLFNSALRNLLMEYIQQQINIGFRVKFDRFLYAMEDLFKLLDTADIERRQQLILSKQPVKPKRTRRTSKG